MSWLQQIGGLLQQYVGGGAPPQPADVENHFQQVAQAADAVYLAWHTNAFDGTAVGTDIYVYGPNPPDGTYQFTGVAGSDSVRSRLTQAT